VRDRRQLSIALRLARFVVVEVDLSAEEGTFGGGDKLGDGASLGFELCKMYG
jgi:hypothetical protein